MVWKTNVNAKMDSEQMMMESSGNGVFISVKEWTGVHSSLVVSLHKTDKHTCWVKKLQLGN